MATHICLKCGWKGDNEDIETHLEKNPKCRGEIAAIGSVRYPHGTYNPKVKASVIQDRKSSKVEPKD